MDLWKKQADFNATFSGVAEIKDGKLTISNKDTFRTLAETVLYNAVFNSDDSLKALARWVIWEASIALGCPSASIHELYMARAENLYKGMTVPAINIRGLTFDVSKTIFETLKKHNAKACLFEIARSEIGYTMQRPNEYTTSVLAAAIAVGWEGPVFLQGDHFQVKASNWKENAKKEVGAVQDLIREAVDAGFYNIDIDTSTLVDLDQESVEEEQRNNYEVTAELTRTVRECEPEGVTISVGGEIGEVGGKNSTVEELIAYLDGVQSELSGDKPITGPSKISIQTGTTHGGVPLPDGSVAQIKLDFDCLEKLGDVGRKQFHVGGMVQHGASTLPQEAFDNFPKTETLEVHLATGFQNIIYDSTHFPNDLRDEIYAWLSKNCGNERKEGQTDEQFYYKTRKKGFGPFKKQLWALPETTKNAVMGELAKTFDMLFTKLGTTDTGELVDKYITTKTPHKPCPVNF